MLKLYNTLTREKEEFKPITSGNAGIYVCGPTVYGPPHVGHARSYINFDTVIRYLKFSGYKVKYIQNITDVGHLTGDSDDGQDKILKQALLEKIDPYEIAYKYETIYFDCMDKLNVLRPTISCRATSFIPEMIEMIEDILKTGKAYITKQGNVYFRVKDFKEYGKLSNRKIENAKSGERIEVASDKENPEDFALWKKAEPEHIMKWKSPWSVGYPGWHLECSTMSRRFLGKTFDIHGGGLDNIFPHHESEFAQSETANGMPFVNYFMHNNLITVDGVKMGKSLGNFITLPDLFKEFSPQTVRFFILQFHYRSPIDFTKDKFIQSQTQLSKIAEAADKLCGIKETKPEGNINTIYENMLKAMDDDFNTPLAISELLALVKEINKNADNKEILSQAAFIFNGFVKEVLGLEFIKNAAPETEIPSDIVNLAEKRVQAKKDKNFALADSLRKEIEFAGYKIIDTPAGYEIKK